jgi:hypothetical protein
VLSPAGGAYGETKFTVDGVLDSDVS